MNATTDSVDFDAYNTPSTPTETMSTTTTPTEIETLRTTLKTPPTMKSVRFHDRGYIRVEEIEEPYCGKGQVKARPALPDKEPTH